jgi:drug/metabolite transporter (DMT)-like permease
MKRSSPLTNVVSLIITSWTVYLIGIPLDGWWLLGSLVVFLGLYLVVHAVVGGDQGPVPQRARA